MVDKLGFGGATLTNLKSLREIMRLLDTAFEFGIRHFDTAPLYGQGYSEVIYGRFLKNKRNQVTLTTKFGLGNDHNTDTLSVHLILALNYIVKSIRRHPAGASSGTDVYKGPDVRKIDKGSIQRSFETSLKRLQTDYVDYYLLHEGLPSFLTDEAFNYLQELKKQGSVRQIGVGTNALGFKTVNASDFVNWDVLQYDGNEPALTKEIMSKLPGHRHFHHSCLKGFHDPSLQHIPAYQRGGYLISQAVDRNPSGKIIFSTRSVSSIKSNVESFLKFVENPGLVNTLLSQKK
ncbi:MAG TPA: aldo/keto reductase [Chryseolinea sp.]|nr:aldo/keto reductase [Chryseolinea sp.]